LQVENFLLEKFFCELSYNSEHSNYNNFHWKYLDAHTVHLHSTFCILFSSVLGE